MVEPEGVFLTVEEAAAVLRIGRTLAYQEAARFEASGGRVGLPVVRIGRVLRVPRAGLEALAGVTLPAIVDDTAPDTAAASDAVLRRGRPARPQALR